MRRRLVRVFAVGAVAVALHDLRGVRRLRRGATDVPAPLDHRGVVGDGGGRTMDLVVLGDSAAAGYGNLDARDAFPQQVASRLVRRRGGWQVRVSAHARSGARTDDVRVQQVHLLRGSHPDVVVVSVGVNDALGRRSSRQVRRDTRALLDALRAAVPQALVVLVGCPDLGRAPGLPWPLDAVVGWRCRRVNGAQRAAAADRGVAFVSYPRPPDATMFGPDGLHPGPSGQAAAAQAVVDVLAPALVEQEEAWTSA